MSLTGDAVTAGSIPGQQPNMTVDEWHECDEMLRAHPAVTEALARRGITDLRRVLADMWAYGAELVPERYARPADRLVRHVVPGSERGNPYARHSPACTPSST